MLLAATLACFAVSSASFTDAEYEGFWSEFMTEHGKTYHPNEVLSRFKVFKNNIDYITAHNKNKASTAGYTLAVNSFADMTRAEWSRKYLGLNAPVTKPRLTSAPLLSEASAPDAVDWVAQGAVTPVKNQGQCGGCWAFSTTGAVEGAVYIATGQLTSLSEQDLIDCASSYGNQGCNGGLMDDGFEYIQARGDASEASYPYTVGTSGRTGTCSTTKATAADGISAGVVTGHTDVRANSEAQLQAAVAQQPVSVAIEADQSDFQFYSSGVFTASCGTSLDHGVLAVGYGTDSGTQYWKVKNSWGTTWGENGYIRMQRNVASSSGQCGIAMQASYPQVSGSSPTPTPTPTPSPAPSPAPTPTPTPTPSASSQYEEPPCTAGEEAVSITGLSGSFCSPSCSSTTSCPAAPSSSTATAQCILSMSGSSSATNCALVCGSTSTTATRKLLGGGSGCPTGATCEYTSSGTGICTYASSSTSATLTRAAELVTKHLGLTTAQRAKAEAVLADMDKLLPGAMHADAKVPVKEAEVVQPIMQ